MNVRFPLCSSILFIITFWKIDFSLTISRSLKGRERSLSIDLCINIGTLLSRFAFVVLFGTAESSSLISFLYASGIRFVLFHRICSLSGLISPAESFSAR
ncbi:hypothetical protein BDQ94DRAFT_36332 [Aspergillus welwitschiae]|uniref:Uncharacterized protein n=1 Tax=Aspergillus welwitschiae TaxID=1341132 RepID=A0A3F3Q2V6_9EURO|nr:hypothetical protein BDQ94DRAFT_36332 [Aspergillus welwitschiae]RDH33006.1 hypothetical protein BDQ94DRAFT_36332 [Aspergillus welwitschiae]